MLNTSQGFTLIELLIVIAIIGILAAVMVPQLMGARATADERAAQQFSSNVGSVSIAWLAANIDKKPADVPVSCNAATTLPSSDGTAFGWNNKPRSVSNCEIIANNSTGMVEAKVTSTKGTIYINGAKQ